MLNHRVLAFAAALSVSALCLAQNEQGTAERTNRDATAIANDTDRQQSNQPQETQNGVDLKFLQGIASDNTLEIRLGQLALQRATDPQVKDVAQMMIQDHTQANQMLQKLAQDHHLQVSTDQLNPVDQAEFDELQEKQGENFTHQYVFSQAGDHLKDVLNVSYHANHADPLTRQYASEILPKLQAHLHALLAIARPMSGDTSISSNGGTPGANGMDAGKP